MIILGREEFTTPRIGCCGMVRRDSIYPIGETVSKEDFVKDAKDLISNYGIGNNNRTADTYSLEYFEADGLINDRGTGKSLYLIRREDDVWNYYEGGFKQFSINNIEAMIVKWQHYLK